MTFIEQLLKKNQKYILSNRYQNTIYNGIPLHEYFGKEKKSKKVGEPFDKLLYEMVENTIPQISLKLMIDYKDLLLPFKHLYVRNNGRYAKINDIIHYINEFPNKILYDVFQPTFFSRYYTLRFYNISSNTFVDETVKDKLGRFDKRIQCYYKCFKDYTLLDINCLSHHNITDYKNLEAKIFERGLIIKHWKLLLDNYDKIISNKDFSNYVVSAFPIKTSVCCCQGGTLHKCYLIDLLNAWKNGFMYDDKPIVHSYGRSGMIYIEIIDNNNEIKRIENQWKPFIQASKPKSDENIISLYDIIQTLKKDED